MDLLIWNSFIRQVYILPRDLALPQTEASPAVSQEHLLPTLSQPQGAQSSVQGRRRDFLQKNVRPLPGGAWQRGGCHCWKVEFLSVAICSSQIKDNTEVRVKVPNHCSKGKLKTKQNRSWLDLPSFCGILILHHLSWAVVPSFPVFPLPLVLNITFKKSILWTLGASSFSGLNLRVTGTWHLFCRLKT